MKLQDGHMVCQHSDHILAHPETETIPVANDDWMDLPDNITPLHNHRAQGNCQVLHLILLYNILQDHPFQQNDMDKGVVLKNLKELEECRY